MKPASTRLYFLLPLLLALLLPTPATAAAAPSYELEDYDPVADPAAVITAGGCARFTVLTPQVIRMEFSPNGTFEDRATVAFLNRRLPVPSFAHSLSNNVLVIDTAFLALTYRYTDCAPFAPGQITIVGKGFTWNFGDADTGNLLGTIRSLDELGAQDLNCTVADKVTVHGESLHCEWGLISRHGWAVVNDTTNYALTDGAKWWDGPNIDHEDLYFFGHGMNYRQALRDFVALAGKVPLLPRYSLGIWWTRWYDINNMDMRKIVDDYNSRSIPLDIFLLDMDWHEKYSWGGYSWDRRLFPYPADTLSYITAQGLHVGANIHDDTGVMSTEDEFVPMCQAMGLDPTTTSVVPLDLTNETYVESLEDIVMRPVEKDGMSFWWIDWQQGGKEGGMTGDKQNPTVWTNKIRCTDARRRGENKRNFVLARFGGLGTHRYPVGFSGDIQAPDWQNLAYQPYFSMTAANVAYGFISHDIAGLDYNSELFVRWVQWGAFSGIMRTHDRGHSAGPCNDVEPPICFNVRIWTAPAPHFEAMRAALSLRASLIPYIYTAARAAYDSGLGLIYPMYYDYPDIPMAYAADRLKTDFNQYFFGPDTIISPVVTPMDKSTRMAAKTLWVPPGRWFETVTGHVYDGGATGVVIKRMYDLSEIPMLCRAGAIVARIPVGTGATLGTAQKQYTALEFDIFGITEASGSTAVYEDAGEGLDYQKGAYAWTNCSYVMSGSSSTMSLTISTNGSFPELPTTRPYILRIVNSGLPTSVTVGGKDVPYSRFGGQNTWTYDGQELAVIVSTSPQPVNVATNIAINFQPGTNNTDGLRGILSHALMAKRNRDEDRSNYGEASAAADAGKLMSLASTTDALSYLANTDRSLFVKTLASLPQMLADAVAETKTHKSYSRGRNEYTYALLQSALP